MKSIYSKLAVAAVLTATVSLANAQETVIKVPVGKTPVTNASAKKRSNGPTKAIKATLSTNAQYVAGTNQDIEFKLILNNTDEEYGDSLSITFPDGFTPVTSPQNPLYTGNDPNATPEALNGVSGKTISWGDNDNSYGGIIAGPTITFTVNVNIAPGTSGIKTGDFFVSGDTYNQNGPAADFAGTFKLSDQAPKADLTAIVVNPFNAYSVPVKHATGQLLGGVTNSNAELKADVDFKFTVTPGGFTESLALANPFPIDSFQIFVTTGNFTATQLGVHSITGEVTYADDNNSTDNVDAADFYVTKDFFCYNGYDTATALALGINTQGYIGSVFHLAVQDTLSNVEAFFKKPFGSANSSVYNFDAATATVGSLVASSTDYTFADTLPQIHNFKYSNAILPAGDYLITIDQTTNGGNFGLGSTFNNYVAGTQFVKIDEGEPTDLDNFSPNLRRSFLFKPQFNVKNVGINEILAASIAIGSNPGNGVYAVTGIEKATVNVMDNVGRIVMTTEINNNGKIDISALPAGNYNLQFVTEQGTAVKKVVMVK